MLTPEEKQALKNALNNEGLTTNDKNLIREILAKDEKGTLTKTDYLTFVKLFYGIMEIIKSFFE